MRSLMLSALLLAGAAGCAPQPQLQAIAVPLAPAFRAATDSTYTAAPPVAAFWTELGDSILGRLVGEAVRGNLDLTESAARVREARANRQLSGYDFLPTVIAVGSYTRQRLSGTSFPGIPAGFEQRSWDAGVDASWELDLFGRIRRNVAGQSALEDAAGEDLRDLQVALVAEVGRTYFELRGAQGQLAVAQRNAENQRRTLQVTQDRLDAGRGTAFDRERASAQLSGTLANIPLLETRVANAIFRLGVLLGRPPASLADTLSVAAELPALPARPSVGTPEVILAHRPDVRSAERQLAAEQSFMGAAQSDYLPRLSVGGTAGFTSNTFGSLAGAGTSRFAVGPVISWPALNLGRVKARVDGARARSEGARARYDRMVLRALEETESALVVYDRSQARLTHLRQAAEASERAADLARLRFEGGIADFLQVLDAERSLLDAQDRLAQGRTDTVTAFVSLYKALGGAWPGKGDDVR
jgi:outer membrane protein, multidrug efflux system